MQKYCFAGMNVCNYSRALFRKIYNYLNKEHLKLSISDGNKRKVIFEVSFRLDSPLNPNLFILSLSKVLLSRFFQNSIMSILDPFNLVFFHQNTPFSKESVMRYVMFSQENIFLNIHVLCLQDIKMAKYEICSKLDQN